MIMKFVDKIFGKVGVDKMLHFAFGGWITAKFCESGILLLAVIGILLVGIASIIKERLDGKFDWKDIAAAMLGGLLELVSWYLIKII
jgi:Flp pilus assembly pilin Flp